MNGYVNTSKHRNLLILNECVHCVNADGVNGCTVGKYTFALNIGEIK